jgi:copper resistance protein B
MRGLLALVAVLAAIPAAAQMNHAGHGQIDHSAHGAQPSPASATTTSLPADPHAGHHMPEQPAAMAPSPEPADPHAGHAMHGTAMDGPAIPVGDAPPPARDWAADVLFPPGVMARARAAMLAEHGAMNLSQLMLNIAEIAPGKGAEGYRWDGEGWFGGDIDRLVVKSEGEGAFGRRLEHAEAQLLYGHALDAYWNIQAGVRQDFGEGPSRRYAVIGIEGLAPYWFDLEGALFLSDKGKLFGRIEATYDQRITQRLVVQPRAEIELAAQKSSRDSIGSGVSDIELGLRLRYEIQREFAPYLGLIWERRLGATARIARVAGEDVDSGRIVLGLRFWI